MEIEPAGRNVLEMQTGIGKIFGVYKFHAASSVPHFCTCLSFDSSLGHNWINSTKNPKNLQIFVIAYFQDNPFYPSRLSKQTHQDGLLGTGGWKARQDPSVCIHSPGKQLYPGLHKRRHGQQNEGGGSASLFWSGETLLCSVLGSSAQERQGSAQAGPEEEHRNYQGDGTAPRKKGWENWGCSLWRWEGFMDTLLRPFSS